jgi:hypothetical protein
MLLNFCQGAVSENFRSNYKLKNSYRIIHSKQENAKDRILNVLGIKEADSGVKASKKLTFKYSLLNTEDDCCKVDHHKSIHSKSL